MLPWTAVKETKRNHSVNETFHQDPPNADKLRQFFARLTRLLYDTAVPMNVVRREVFPYFSHNIVFLDPLVHIQGWQKFADGRRGFHCTFKFDFDIIQLGVQLNNRNDGGRVLVDGIMNLRSLIFYTYPLRTMLVYEFRLTKNAPGVSITRLEEMWSTGDLFANVPVLGRAYDGVRRGFGWFILGLFAFSCAINRHIRQSA